MCYVAIVGAETEPFRLREVLSADGSLDTELPPDRHAASYFPLCDSLVSVTLDGCSCALLGVPAAGKALRQRGKQRATFHAALGRAVVRFGGVRVLVRRTGRGTYASLLTERVTTLAELLRGPELRGEYLLRVVAA